MELPQKQRRDMRPTRAACHPSIALWRPRNSRHGLDLFATTAVRSLRFGVLRQRTRPPERSAGGRHQSAAATAETTASISSRTEAMAGRASTTCNGMAWLIIASSTTAGAPVRNLRRAPEQRANLVKTFLTYLSYRVTPLDNISYHSVCVDDMQGEHIGTKARYTGR